MICLQDLFQAEGVHVGEFKFDVLETPDDGEDSGTANALSSSKSE